MDCRKTEYWKADSRTTDSSNTNYKKAYLTEEKELQDRRVQKGTRVLTSNRKLSLIILPRSCHSDTMIMCIATIEDTQIIG
ncbi:TPA: hypothetical protein I7726_09585 [Vibrio vulnificus]|nr:hypothetical protein [Vibrio vulnificus]